ncbi:MAG: hypothetical protein IT337_01750, partial [Thermomicrobiales bacterium]|nr:hypothetical protein [Thermomicrobiales bacterium]
RERDLLRARDEADFFLMEDDEDEDDALTSETEEDEPVEPDNEGFIDESGPLNDEDEHQL